MNLYTSFSFINSQKYNYKIIKCLNINKNLFTKITVLTENDLTYYYIRSNYSDIEICLAKDILLDDLIAQFTSKFGIIAKPNVFFTDIPSLEDTCNINTLYYNCNYNWTIAEDPSAWIFYKKQNFNFSWNFDLHKINFDQNRFKCFAL
jgi:hypothetical protein